MYIDKLDDIDNESNTCYRTTKMEHLNVKSSAYINVNVENNDKDPKFEVGDHVRISKHGNIFAKGYAPNRSEEVFMMKNVKNAVLWTYDRKP